jgi:predicted methyltransferase MtxX (methanogen marker protein 4)
MSGENYETEKVTIIVDNVVLQGLESELISTNAVSKSYVDSKVQTAVDDLINGAGPAYDTLKELSDALNAGDASLGAQIINSIASEQTSRESADVLLNARADALSMSIESESSSRSAADVVINSRIDTALLDLETESVNRAAADALINGRVDVVNVDIENLQSSKANLSGAEFTGDVKMVDSYLMFGNNWRVRGSADGTKIVFQHMKNDGVWRNALPFICQAN